MLKPIQTRLTWIVAVLLMMVIAVSVNAQEDPSNGTLPDSVKLQGITQIWQDFNRCSAAAFTMEMSYYDWGGTYDDMKRLLNPHAEDVSVRVEEMIAVAEQYGLKGIVRTGGTLDILKSLVAAGFPVLVENVYYDGPNGWKDWMSHNRVIMGYDEAQQVFYTFDSLLGSGPDKTGRPVSYAELDERWKPFNRDYLVIYQPGDEAFLKSVLGEQWDATYNAEWTLAQAERELAEPDPDSFSLFNKGLALTALGRYQEAADVFDEARRIGLPWRMFWYQFGAFEAYLAVGRYDDTLALVQQVLATTPGVEEMYYYAGRAYEALGNVSRAEANYQVAVLRNVYFTEAQDALKHLQGVTTTAGS